MNGFRNFVLVMLVSIGLALWVTVGPKGCRLPDIADCTYNDDLHTYECPEENK